MAAEVVSLREFVTFMKSLKDMRKRANARALIATMQDAKLEAARNIKRNFTGRNGRTLSGQLLNNLFSMFQKENENFEGLLGVRTVPYARINEYGGEIKPIKAQKLWIPIYRTAGKMTPREFITLKQKNPGQFFITDKVAARKEGKKIVPLFMRVDKSVIPARPYLTPALELATEKFPDRFEQFFAEEVK